MLIYHQTLESNFSFPCPNICNNFKAALNTNFFLMSLLQNPGPVKNCQNTSSWLLCKVGVLQLQRASFSFISCYAPLPILSAESQICSLWILVTACKVKRAESCSSHNRFYLLLSAYHLEKNPFFRHLNWANLIWKKQQVGVEDQLFQLTVGF